MRRSPTEQASKPKSKSRSLNKAERRRATRTPYDGLVRLSVLGRNEECIGPFQVQAMDISISGIAVVARQMMHPGTIGALELFMPDGTTTVVGVEVMNCHYAGEMKHRIGLRFTPLHRKFAGLPEFQAGCRVLESSQAHETFQQSLGVNGPGSD